MTEHPLDRLARAALPGQPQVGYLPRPGPRWLIYAQPRPGRSRYHCQCEIGKDGIRPALAASRIGFDELHDQPQGRRVACTGSRRQSPINSNLIWPRAIRHSQAATSADPCNLQIAQRSPRMIAAMNCVSTVVSTSTFASSNSRAMRAAFRYIRRSFR